MKKGIAWAVASLLVVLGLGVLAVRHAVASAQGRLARARAALPPEVAPAEGSWCFAPLKAANTDLWFNEGSLVQLTPYLQGKGPLPVALEGEVAQLKLGLPAFFGCPPTERVSPDEGARLVSVPLLAVAIRDEFNRGDLERAAKECLQAVRWTPVLSRSQVDLRLVTRFVEGLAMPCGDVFHARAAPPDAGKVLADALPTPEQQAGQVWGAEVLRAFGRLERVSFSFWLVGDVFELRREEQRLAAAERLWDSFRTAPASERQKWSDSFDALVDNARVGGLQRETLNDRWKATELLRERLLEFGK
ncbi:MAG: hypothetical protein U0228_07635 [Myxococcaceae bacterium]